MFETIESKLKIEYGENSNFRFGKFYIIIKVLGMLLFLSYLSSSFNIELCIIVSATAIMIYGVIQTKKYGLYLLYGLVFYRFIESIFGIIDPQSMALIELETMLENVDPHPSYQGPTEGQLDSMIFRARFRSVIVLLFNLYVIQYFNKKKKIFINANQK